MLNPDSTCAIVVLWRQSKYFNFSSSLLHFTFIHHHFSRLNLICITLFACRPPKRTNYYGSLHSSPQCWGCRTSRHNTQQQTEESKINNSVEYRWRAHIKVEFLACVWVIRVLCIAASESAFENIINELRKKNRKKNSQKNSPAKTKNHVVQLSRRQKCLWQLRWSQQFLSEWSCSTASHRQVERTAQKKNT